MPDPTAAVGQGRLRVLVVDDNRDAADTLARVLRLWGFETSAAYDAPAALDLARDAQPDCLVLDIAMPGMDGCALARQLRRDPALADSLLVALTAYSDPLTQRQIFEAGFDHHLVKPADLDTLADILRERAGVS